MRQHRPGIVLSPDATKTTGRKELNAMFCTVQHLEFGDVQGDFFDTAEMACACFSSLYRNASAMVIQPDGKELKFYGLRSGGRDAEMRQWWMYHTRQSEETGNLKDSCLQRDEVRKRAQQALVVVNVYNLGHATRFKVVNSPLRLFGSGVYHAGVEVYGKEISYGGFPADYAYPDEPGLFWSDPRGCEAHSYRESVLLGKTALSQVEVKTLINTLKCDYPGGQYNILENNCCHFSNRVCEGLGVRALPTWILHLAGVGAGVANTVADGMEARSAAPDDGYHFGDFTRGVVSRVVTQGKHRRGASREANYQFGDVTRGVVSWLGNAACSRRRSAGYPAESTPILPEDFPSSLETPDDDETAEGSWASLG